MEELNLTPSTQLLRTGLEDLCREHRAKSCLYITILLDQNQALFLILLLIFAFLHHLDSLTHL